jgi:hypothetical protein
MRGPLHAHLVQPGFDQNAQSRRPTAGYRPDGKSRYLVNATVWVDKTIYGIVRLDGTTAASVSVWVGSPHVVEDFVPVSAIWVPVHNRSTSTSMLLG